jgi:hypothetical protein
MTTMKSKKLRQIAASIFVLLSLCVSSIAACACAHHHPETVKVETEQSSCHGSGNHVETAPQQETAVEDGTSDCINVSCECFLQAAPRVSAKHENLKVAKQAIVQTAIDPERVLVQTGSDHISTGFYSTELFVSDPHYNLTPGRAPPRL